MEKLKVIIKHPGESVGHMTWVTNDLKKLQQIVDGHIEVVTLDPAGLLMLCNEDGKNRGLPMNLTVRYNVNLGKVILPKFDDIVGTVVLVGADGENFGDVPIDLQTWKDLLWAWGNKVQV